jgi:hypothetical protein
MVFDVDRPRSMFDPKRAHEIIQELSKIHTSYIQVSLDPIAFIN